MIDYIKIGQISNAHGIKGEVKVYPLTDNIKRFSKLKFVYLKTRDEYVKVDIEGVKYLNDNVILKMAKVETMNDALKYKNEYVYIEDLDCIFCNLLECPIGSKCLTDLPKSKIMISFEKLLEKNNIRLERKETT